MTDEPTTKVRRPRRRWPPWTLAAVILLAWLAAALVLLTAVFGPHFRYQYVTNREIHRLGIEAHRLGGWAGVYEGGVDFWNDWVSVTVDLGDTPVDDEQLAHLLRMPAFRNVMNLSLEGTHVTDRGLDLLVDQRSVFLLDVSRTRVTDHGLASIAKMQGLVELNLSGTPISDRGIETLIAHAGSSHLRSVSLRHTEVSQAAAERLRKTLFQATITLSPANKR